LDSLRDAKTIDYSFEETGSVNTAPAAFPLPVEMAVLDFLDALTMLAPVCLPFPILF